MFMAVDRIERNRTSLRRRARAEAAVAVAVRDFQALGSAMAPVEVMSTGTYAGHPVIVVRFGVHDYVIGDGEHARVVVNLVRLLQVIATRGNTQWPSVPGIGALTTDIRNGCGVWVMPNGIEFCEIGHIFMEIEGAHAT